MVVWPSLVWHQVAWPGSLKPEPEAIPNLDGPLAVKVRLRAREKMRVRVKMRMKLKAKVKVVAISDARIT